jgi:8-amino-7-oxononanoate synthase
MTSLDAFARDKLAALEAGALRRRLTETGRGPEAAAARGGRVLTSFSCNDYLGLSHHPRVVAAGQAALAAHGAGAGGSRLVTGNHPILTALENRLAAHKGKEAALVFGSGYLANLGITPALASRQDLVLLDELSHACMWAGAKLSGATIVAFRHNDVEALEKRLKRLPPEAGKLVVLEGVYSMLGDIAPLKEMVAVSKANGAMVLVDEAHSMGFIGENGRGVAEAQGVIDDVDFIIGTFSKSVGTVGRLR